MNQIFRFLSLGRRKQSIEESLKPHLETLYRQAYRYVSNEFDAEDLLQDVLLDFFRNQDKIECIENTGAWLNRCLYHRFVDHYRREGRKPSMNDIDDPELQAHLHGDLLDEQQYFEQQLIKGLDLLSMHQKAVITLHDLCGFTLPEIEKTMSLPIGTLKSHLHRGRKALQRHLELEPTMLQRYAIEER
ncbi:RNA polymerase sigma factor [Pseudoteredinibacter isoporae]|uniref:RNA polymerase sigma factor n=1 Tax=Pseudoteredinibacter isoporae TaxID=570281 RepID=UPI00310A4B3A